MRIIAGCLLLAACSVEPPATSTEVWGIYDVHRVLTFQVRTPKLDWPEYYQLAIAHDRVAVIANTTTVGPSLAVADGLAQFRGAEEWTSVVGAVAPQLDYELDATDPDHLVGSATSILRVDGTVYDFVFDIEAWKRVSP